MGRSPVFGGKPFGVRAQEDVVAAFDQKLMLLIYIFGVMCVDHRQWEYAAAINPGTIIIHFLRQSEVPSARRSSSSSCPAFQRTQRHDHYRHASSTPQLRTKQRSYGICSVFGGLIGAVFADGCAGGGRRRFVNHTGRNRLRVPVRIRLPHAALARIALSVARCSSRRFSLAGCARRQAAYYGPAPACHRRPLYSASGAYGAQGYAAAPSYNLDTGDRVHVSVFGQDSVSNSFGRCRAAM